MNDTVGAYDAKTHLSRLLDEVERGSVITITKHGRAVARLVPADASTGSAAETAAALLAARAGVRRGRNSIRRMIEEGRR